MALSLLVTATSLPSRSAGECAALNNVLTNESGGAKTFLVSFIAIGKIEIRFIFLTTRLRWLAGLLGSGQRMVGFVAFYRDLISLQHAGAVNMCGFWRRLMKLKQQRPSLILSRV